MELFEISFVFLIYFIISSSYFNLSDSVQEHFNLFDYTQFMYIRTASQY